MPNGPSVPLEDRIVRELRAVGCDHTSALAQMLGVPRQTMRRALDRLEDQGRVEGTKHDERNTGGRIRVYWSAR